MHTYSHTGAHVRTHTRGLWLRIKCVQVVDKSGSMDATEHGRTRYTEAKLAAEHLAEKIEVRATPCVLRVVCAVLC